MKKNIFIIFLLCPIIGFSGGGDLDNCKTCNRKPLNKIVTQPTTLMLAWHESTPPSQTGRCSEVPFNRLYEKKNSTTQLNYIEYNQSRYNYYCKVLVQSTNATFEAYKKEYYWKAGSTMQIDIPRSPFKIEVLYIEDMNTRRDCFSVYYQYPPYLYPSYFRVSNFFGYQSAISISMRFSQFRKP